MSSASPEPNPTGSELPKAKRPRTSVACERCRRKRAKCDGRKPTCSLCEKSGAACEYAMNADKRKPYTKAVVAAMQLRIETLEARLQSLTGSVDTGSEMITGDAAGPSSGGMATGFGGGDGGAGPSWASTAPIPVMAPPEEPTAGLDTFQGGLAVNAHGELRFYGPTSSYRSVLADSTSLLNTPATVNAIRAFSLTRAPIPTQVPSDPSLPRRPPDLSPDFKAHLFTLAFENCFAHYNIVPEREFYRDLQMYPFERTSFYSPFLTHCILAVGCRYLEPDEDWPSEICGLIGDFESRGDVFCNWARYLVDQELYSPGLSTIRGLLVLGLYLAGRGFDGPCLMFVKSGLTLAIDFGLNLSISRLTMNMGVTISEETIVARRDCFWSAFSSDLIASLYIGRPPSFSPDMVDVAVPPVVPELDYDEPMYRSSSFHWSSKLMIIASKILATVYSLRPGVSLQARHAVVPELHLLLENWYHGLPSYLRASGSDPAKAPHPHILVLQLSFNMLFISLHRPFFRRHSSDPSTNISTDKCLSATANIVRLVKLLRGSAGLSRAAPGVQHAAFNAGTVLAISAVEDGISSDEKEDAARKAQAKKDLKLIVTSLKEIGATWTTAHTSAGVLEALTQQWEALSQPPDQPGSYAQDDILMSASTSSAQFHSPASSASTLGSISSSSHLSSASYPLPTAHNLSSGLPIPVNASPYDPSPINLPPPPLPPQSHSHHFASDLASATSFSRNHHSAFDDTPTASGATTPAAHAAAAANALGMMGFPSRPGTAGGGGMASAADGFGFGFSSMFPSFGFGESLANDGGGGGGGGGVDGMGGGLDLSGLWEDGLAAGKSQSSTPAEYSQ